MARAESGRMRHSRGFLCDLHTRQIPWDAKQYHLAYKRSFGGESFDFVPKRSSDFSVVRVMGCTKRADPVTPTVTCCMLCSWNCTMLLILGTCLIYDGWAHICIFDVLERVLRGFMWFSRGNVVIKNCHVLQCWLIMPFLNLLSLQLCQRCRTRCLDHLLWAICAFASILAILII